MKIFDCFTYFNEEEMLRIRMEEIGDIVDYFVIVEAKKTFTNQVKPTYLDRVGSWIDRWSYKIIRVVKSSFPDSLSSTWGREIFQRNSIMDGLFLADLDDVIIISDADEIVDRSIVKKVHKLDLPVRLDNKQFFWNYNWMVPDHCNQGARPVVVRRSDLVLKSPQGWREDNILTIPNAGWHFSYFSDYKDIVKKIESFSHVEYDKSEFKDLNKIKFRIDNGIDPFDRFPLKYFEVDETYPVYVKKLFNIV